MWSVASSSAALTQSFTDTGTLLAVGIAAVLVGMIALLGLGFGIRHLKKYVTGRKF